MVKVLVVDDDKLIRDLLRTLFEGRAYTVIEAENSDDGIEKARSEQPRLIILDMSLPGMTGWEVLPILRSHPRTREIPVIALTAHDSPESRDEAHAAGCNQFVAKPVDAARLMAAVDSLLD